METSRVRPGLGNRHDLPGLQRNREGTPAQQQHCGNAPLQGPASRPISTEEGQCGHVVARLAGVDSWGMEGRPVSCIR